MRYDLTIPLVDLSGVQVTDAVDPTGYTLGTALVRSALWIDKVKLPTPPEKQAAYLLAKRIATAGASVDLSIEDVAFLKAQAGAMWSTLVMGQIWELLEQPLAGTSASPLDAELYRKMFPDKPVAGIPEEA